MLSVYSAVAKTRFLSRLAYPGSSVIGVMLQQVTSTLVVLYIWKAVYSSDTSIDGYSIGSTLTYILAASSLAAFSNTYLIQAVGYALRGGEITKELLRPVNYQTMMSVLALSQMAFYGIFVALTWAFISVAAGLQLPNDPATWILFFIMLLIGILNALFFDWILTTVVFVTLDPMGMVWLRQALVTFFGGAIVPLHFMPEWLQDVARIFPYYQAVFVPSNLLSGGFTVAQASRVIPQELLWTLCLWLISSFLLRKAMAKVTVQGG